MPFPQMGVAFTTKAIDAGLLITPYTAQFPVQKIAEEFVNVDDVAKPQPMSISVSMFNTDWAKQNPEAIQKFYTRGDPRHDDYCNAYHGGAWRTEASSSRLLVANGVARTTELLDKIRWPARNPDGRISRDFMTDVQRWYVKAGVVRSEAPLESGSRHALRRRSQQDRRSVQAGKYRRHQAGMRQVKKAPYSAAL